MKIIPLTVTQINWPNLLQSSMTVAGRSPVSMLDQERNGERGAYAFIASLSELHKPDLATKEALRNGIDYFGHYFIGFLVECSEVESDAFRPLEGLTVTHFQGLHHSRRANLDFLIISGTLAQWVPLVKYYLKAPYLGYVTSTRKEFFQEVYNLLSNFSLREIFE